MRPAVELNDWSLEFDSGEQCTSGISNYHVLHECDSDHAVQYCWPREQRKGIADQRDISSHTMGFDNKSPSYGKVAGWNDENKVVQLLSYFYEQPMNIEQ